MFLLKSFTYFNYYYKGVIKLGQFLNHFFLRNLII